MAIKKAKICTVTSVKGGTGKSTLLLNLAGIYSNQNKKVLILDFDLFTGCIAALLNVNVKNDIYNLYEDMNNNTFQTLDDYIIRYNENISLVAAPKDPRLGYKIKDSFFTSLISKVISQYDYILIDTNHCLNEVNLISFDLSTKIIYVINNDMMNLKNMRTMNTILNSMGNKEYLIVLNKSLDGNRNYFSEYDIKNIIKKNVDYIIPSSFYIKNIDKYTMAGEILTLNKFIVNRYRKSIKKLEMIAANIENSASKGDEDE